MGKNKIHKTWCRWVDVYTHCLCSRWTCPPSATPWRSSSSQTRSSASAWLPSSHFNLRNETILCIFFFFFLLSDFKNTDLKKKKFSQTGWRLLSSRCDSVCPHGGDKALEKRITRLNRRRVAGGGGSPRLAPCCWRHWVVSGFVCELVTFAASDLWRCRDPVPRGRLVYIFSKFTVVFQTGRETFVM